MNPQKRQRRSLQRRAQGEEQQPAKKATRKPYRAVEPSAEPVKPKRRRRTGPRPTSTPGFIQGQNRTNKETD